MKLYKILIFISLLFSFQKTFANKYNEINYTLSYIDKPNLPFINVIAEIKGKFSDKVIIDLPNTWAGVNYFSQIKNVKSLNPKYKFKITQTPHPQIIIYIPAELHNISVNYDIYPPVEDKSDIHTTIIRKNLIHSPGYGLFATPSDIKDDDKIQFNIKWDNLPGHWKTLSSHGIDLNLRFINSCSKLLHAFYIAGDLRIKKILDDKYPVYLSLYGKFNEKDKDIAFLLGKIIKSQRVFFNDYNFPYYAISLIEGDKLYSHGGTGFDNSFTAYFPQNSNKDDISILFAHEHLHSWIGGKIRNDKDEELNYWWSEGFTDYYSRVLAARSGVITFEKFTEECNQFLADYYLSPALNASNITIKKNFWKNETVQKLPYYRGFVFAIYLNNLIQKNNLDKSLDNIILDLLKTSKEKAFSIKYFKDLVKFYVFGGIDKEIEEYITKGKTIDLNKVTINLPLKKVNMTRKENNPKPEDFKSVYQLKPNLNPEDKAQIIKFFRFN